MPYYRVFLKGENFWLQFEERLQPMGFFTTRFVEAATEEAAKKVAINRIHSEGRLKPHNHPDDPPRIVANRIEKVKQSDIPGNVPGFAFFPDEPLE